MKSDISDRSQINNFESNWRLFCTLPSNTRYVTCLNVISLCALSRAVKKKSQTDLKA